MGFRFRKSISIAKGLRVNLSKTGGSLSVGHRGDTINIGKRGVYSTLGYPGSGLSYRQKIGAHPAADAGDLLLGALLVVLALWAIGHFGVAIFH
ncbi:DUF4236 domain-containing protein [Paraburkholderia sp.]|uniref:DUF4236 domain-containing protein n=1 Tax=Paraburkholderia sp. TaxID=1926495 RepID=UPI003C7EC247